MAIRVMVMMVTVVVVIRDHRRVNMWTKIVPRRLLVTVRMAESHCLSQQQARHQR
ncbi:hypothetical protein [Kolteria novifilia]|uniref:hypothetical protein n=1 Tax=Kolteria novifilia TaxID=2527975 RepID=UPI003AF33F7D